ncbi:MAG: hypothetical protein A2782_03495 [Candidatus Blackburnbacteria bacterium RIFCSPHIGHO2_01_FULL_43_15b]|uniref:Uncharacterized protein n=1 Tax=Candidatus Blackburnbacteria bacterium RIFCSPHIGHO2_01_FULL_43_15b TaxID=1797513 RepID=A0A1G1V049_9BACT|nr:MAG: hypothetical protein A2782_03495 [Candidatus Blackburnbacteria bacterium RIFCSPHIGHO2_01_FULL_43_15b]
MANVVFKTETSGHLIVTTAEHFNQYTNKVRGGITFEITKLAGPEGCDSVVFRHSSSKAIPGVKILEQAHDDLTTHVARGEPPILADKDYFPQII